MMHSSRPLWLLFLLVVVLGCCCVTTASLSRDDPIAEAMQARLDGHDDTDDHEYSKDSDDHDFDDFAGLTDEELEAIEQQLLFLDANANNSTAVHRTLKKLKRLFPKYKTPKWFNKYSEMIGRPYLQKCNSWIIDHEVPPRSGSIYCPRRSGNYTCFFGEQMCPELRSSDRPHPNAQCTCVDKQWRCHDWECPEPFFYKKCPKKSPLGNPKVPTRCVGDKTCEYGTETCCGQTFPSVVCKCVDGNYVCRNTEACRGKVCDPIKKCPKKSPLETGDSLQCKKALECEYGEETCCDGDISGPSVKCTCDKGDQLSCFNTDLCFRPGCPPKETRVCPEKSPLETGDEFECKKDLSCTYPDGSVCTCAKGKDFKCVKPDPDDGQEINTCPEESPLDTGLELTCGKALSCGYDEFRCCPTDAGFPITQCGCDKGGKLTCNLVQPICPAFCPPAEVDTCPPGNPTQGAQEITCTKKLEDCMYGEARCCPEDDPVPNLKCSCDAGGALECEPEFLICPAVLCPSQLLDSCPLVNPLEDPDMFTDKFCNADFDGCMYGEARCCPEDDPVPNVKCSCSAGQSIECEPEFLICPAVLCPSQLLNSCPSVNPLENPDMFTNKFCNADFDGCVYGETDCCGGTASTAVCSCSAGQTIECEEVECDGDDCAEPLEQCPEEDPSLSGIFPLCGESFFGCQYGEVNCCPGQDPTPARTCACTEGEAIQCTDQTSCASVLCPFDPLGPIPEPIDPEDKQPKECPATNPEELDSAAVCTNSYQGCKYDFKQCCKGQPPFLAVTCDCVEGEQPECVDTCDLVRCAAPPEIVENKDPNCPDESPFFTGEFPVCTTDLPQCVYGPLVECCPGQGFLPSVSCACETGDDLFCFETCAAVTCPRPDPPSPGEDCPAKRPVHGESCAIDPLEECLYGPKETCCDGEVFDTYSCACDSTSNTWYCQFLDECAGTVCIENDASCPENPPGPNDDCDYEGETCKYGQEECCGESSHSYQCSCFEGKTACLFTDFCLGSGIFGCPVVDSCPPTTAPRFETGTACKDGLNCKFGAEKCCGKTQPEIECNCLDEEFECRYVDRCRDIECA